MWLWQMSLLQYCITSKNGISGKLRYSVTRLVFKHLAPNNSVYSFIHVFISVYQFTGTIQGCGDSHNMIIIIIIYFIPSVLHSTKCTGKDIEHVTLYIYIYMSTK